MARQTFAYTGTYPKQRSVDPIEGFAFFEESIEPSRRFRALKLWLSLRCQGLQAFRAVIRPDREHAQRLAATVKQAPVLELLAPGDLCVVCVRQLVRADASEDLRNRCNLALLKRTLARGRTYLSNAELKGNLCLRACIVNPLTKVSDIDGVVPEVLDAARASMAELAV
jgi:aromatic-L-amino-acid/L-tryptophan decarboxylase